MISFVFITLIVIFMLASLYSFLNNKKYKRSFFSPAIFYQLFFTLMALMIGFALIYYVLSLNTVVLRIGSPTGEPADETFWNLLYFSGVTLLAIGYGDYVPVGLAKAFALFEACIGLILPTACFLKAMTSNHEKESDKN